MSRLNHSKEALASLRQEISDLRSRLSNNSEDGNTGLSTPDSFSEEIEWRSKYERLYESYRRLQKTNVGLEDKLLRVVDKFEAEKNQMTRDLAGQTQKLVEAKLTIQRLSDQNRDLHSDLNLSINLLRTRPSSFVSPKIEDLPAEVKSRIAKGQRPLAVDKSKKILVAVPSEEAENGRVSAAILAKVLEERDKERRAEAKFCIDVGTQTHGWNLNNKTASSSASNSPSLSSSSSPDRILLASVIHQPNGSKDMMMKTSATLASLYMAAASTTASVEASPLRPQPPQFSILQRSATFSSTQTDI